MREPETTAHQYCSVLSTSPAWDGEINGNWGFSPSRRLLLPSSLASSSNSIHQDPCLKCKHLISRHWIWPFEFALQIKKWLSGLVGGGCRAKCLIFDEISLASMGMTGPLGRSKHWAYKKAAKSFDLVGEKTFHQSHSFRWKLPLGFVSPHRHRLNWTLNKLSAC